MGFSYGYAADKQDAISLIRTAVERVLHSSLLLKPTAQLRTNR